jgi:hypothetical protein
VNRIASGSNGFNKMKEHVWPVKEELVIVNHGQWGSCSLASRVTGTSKEGWKQSACSLRSVSCSLPPHSQSSCFSLHMLQFMTGV